MAPYVPDEAEFVKLKGKVLVLTGGASGVGTEVVKLFHAHGGHVVFGDVSEEAGTTISTELSTNEAKVNFERMDTAKYSDVVRLFRKAFALHGRIDYSIPCAAILGDASLYDPSITIENIDLEPDMAPLDVNLKGTAYFARVALAYLNHGHNDNEDRSITLIASDMPVVGMTANPVYQMSKSGVLQLMRTLRPILDSEGKATVRVNAICPNVTVTAMVHGWLTDTWQKENLPLNTAQEVARLIVSVASQTLIVREGQNGRQLHGMTFDITGNQTWEIEDDYEANIRNWTGEDSWNSIVDIRKLFHRLQLPIWGS